MQKSVYFPDDKETQKVITQVQALEKVNRRSFSELVYEGLRLLVQTTGVNIEEVQSSQHQTIDSD